MLTFIIFASYVTQNTGAKPKVHPDSGSLPKTGGLAYKGKPRTPTCLARNSVGLGKVSWTLVKEGTSQLASWGAASGIYFIFRSFRKPYVRNIWLTASCRWHVGVPEFCKRKFSGLGLSSVDLKQSVSPAAPCRVTHFNLNGSGAQGDWRRGRKPYDRLLTVNLATYFLVSLTLVAFLRDSRGFRLAPVVTVKGHCWDLNPSLSPKPMPFHPLSHFPSPAGILNICSYITVFWPGYICEIIQHFLTLLFPRLRAKAHSFLS